MAMLTLKRDKAKWFLYQSRKKPETKHAQCYGVLCCLFSGQLKRIPLIIKKIVYNTNILQQTACMVINPVVADTLASRAQLFKALLA